jgi:phospholipid-binding lipoprotein MlaA
MFTKPPSFAGRGFFLRTMNNNKSLFLSLTLLVGCQAGLNPADPYEEYNRQVFSFNEQADEYFFNPITNLYTTCIPLPFRLMVHNFYLNVSEIAYTINAGLQGEWNGAYNSSLRFLVNSTFGVGGLLEMAQPLGLERQPYDFGQTLYFYGYKDSPYYVMPIFGPATVRDSCGLYIDKFLLFPLTYVQPLSARNAFFAGNVIDGKASVAEYLKNFPEPSYVNDRYIFVRDLYLQYRSFQLSRQQVDWDTFYDQ